MSFTSTLLVEKFLITAGTQGPSGPPGSSGEEEEMYAKRVDFEGDIIYRGEAAVGALESALVWRIRRIALAPADGDVVEIWANGTAEFVHAWADRLSLEYS